MDKFKVGDKVIYDGFLGQYKGEIFGISKKDVKGGKYAITVKGNLDYINLLVEKENLQSVEIEKGDTVELELGEQGVVEYIFNKKEKYDRCKRCVVDLKTHDGSANYFIKHLDNLKLVEKGGN